MIESFPYFLVKKFSHLHRWDSIPEQPENAAIMKILEEIGVDYTQGYYIDEPKPFD